MAELKITANISQAQSQLKILDTELTALKNKATELKIDIKGVDTLQKLTSALQQYSKSQVDATNALSKAKQAEIDLLNAKTKNINATQNLARKKQEEINIDKRATLEKEKQTTAQIKLSTAQEKTAQTANRLSAEQEKTSRALLKTESSAKRLGDAWSKMFSQFSLSSMISSAATRAIYMMRQYFREALNEMKELDTALTHYRQVTGASASEAAQIGEEAYSVGSRYGTKASDYAESVATYARAGYGEVADELAELSLKTVIVGQTTQEIADQFLLTMDAAYGYKGSVEELSRVLDGASAIDSSYATTIEKIASGLGLVAPLAKQVHVSEEQLTAAIGTITATTQRSGAESARALRSLFLNIIKDTTTEIEDGVTATEESIKDMDTLLNKYAKSAVDAAKASGEVINPMEAIGALAESMKEGFLTEAELMDMMSSLGGKLRVSQLVALVSNWDMYNDMIQTYENSMGSADQKTETYLDSWEAKTNVLKNTWTQFIASSLNTDFIKGFITGVTNLVSKLDNLGNALKLIATIVAGIKMAKRIADLRSTSAAMQQMATTTRASAEATKAMAIEAGLAGNTEQNATLATRAYTLSQQADIAATQARAAAQKALAMTIGTLVVSALLIAASAYANYHRQRMQELEEERDEAIETAKVQQDKADEVYKAYAEYWNAKELKDKYGEAKISAEEYETAVYNLATALGVQETAFKDNEEALERLSKREQERAKIKTEDALQEAKLAAQEELESYGHKFKSQFTSPEYRLWEQYGVEPTQQWRSYTIPLGQLANETDVEKAAQLYQRLTKLKGIYLQASKQDTDVADEYGKSYRELSNALSQYAGILEPVVELQNELAKYDKQELNIETGNIESAEDAKDAIDAEGDAAEEAQKKFHGLADAIAESQKELQNYQEQTKEAKDDAYASYADIWKKGFEDYQKGYRNSTAQNAGLDAFFTPEQLLRMREKDIDAIEELYGSEFWQGIFTYMNEKGEQEFINDDSGANFIWALFDKYADEAGKIKNKAGEVVASFTDNNGLLSVTVEDFEALAEALGELDENAMDIDPNFLAALFQALGNYGEEIANTPAEINAIAESLDALNEKDEINLEELVTGKLKLGEPTQDVIHLYENILKLNEVSDSGVKIHVEEGDNLDNVKSRVEELIKNRDDLADEPADVEVTYDGKEAEEGLNKVIQLEIEAQERSPHITVTLVDEASSKLDDINNKKLNDKTVDVYYRIHDEKVKDRLASGTKNARGGLTLVNEKGAEIIQEGDSARIAGNGKPTLTWLQSGATVYTATETKAILGGANYGDLFDGINSYAGGSPTGIPRYTPEDAKPKEDTSPSTSPSSSPSTSPKTTEKKSDKDEELERLKDIVALRESELNLLEAQDAPYKKLIKKYEEINKAIQDEIEHLQKTKGNEKEINDLKVKQLKNEKEIKKLEEEQVEKQKNRLKNIVELRKSELQLIQAKGGSIKEQIKKERQIYQAIEKQIIYAKKHGATKKEINELLEEQYKVQKNINDLNKELYDTLKGSINKEVDKLNEKRDKELEKIDKRIEKIQKSNDEEKKATELQEKQLAVEEARDKLSKARQERTIRYYNAAKGQWEWRADQQQVDTAKKELEDAKKALKDYKDQQKLDKRVADLEKKKEEVTQKYLEKTDQWQKVLDSLEEPVKSVAQSLKAIEKNATKDQKSTIQALNKLLKPLGYNIDVSKLYDSGGILTGTGGIKGTSKDEVILPPDIASKMLKPISTATLNSRLNELRYLYGATNMNPSGVMNSSIGSQYNGNLYTFGNITLTEGQARSTTIYELVQTSRGLRAYSAM